MNTTKQDEGDGFDFDKPATYQITVKGKLDPLWSNRLGDMQIRVIKKHQSKPVSILTGMVMDQSALSGILNSLYELHLTILSVKALKNIEDTNLGTNDA